MDTNQGELTHRSKLQTIMGTFVNRKLLYQMPGADVRERAKSAYGIDLG